MFAEAATASAGGSGADGGREQRGEPGAELGPVGFGDAEQLADHGERQREGEARDQVDDGVAAGCAGRRAGVDDRLDPGRSAAIRGRLNAAAASRRSRVWSGGSTLSMCRANAGPGRPSATTSPSRASAACMSLDSRGSLSAARASSCRTTSQAAVPVGQRDLVHRAGGPDLREQRERVVAVVVTPRVERRMTHVDHLSSDLAEAGTQQVDRRQPVVDDLADQRLRAGPAGAALRQVQPVVDQQPVGDRFARRLHQLDGVEVGEPPGEAGDDGVTAVGLDRAAGQQRPQPDGVGQRGGQPPAVAAGDGGGDRGGDGMVCS